MEKKKSKKKFYKLKERVSLNLLKPCKSLHGKQTRRSSKSQGITSKASRGKSGQCLLSKVLALQLQLEISSPSILLPIMPHYAPHHLSHLRTVKTASLSQELTQHPGQPASFCNRILENRKYLEASIHQLELIL